MRELVHRGAANPSTDGVNDRRAVGTVWCVRDRGTRQPREADGALTAEARDRPGLRRNTGFPTNSHVAKFLDDSDSIRQVPSI